MDKRKSEYKPLLFTTTMRSPERLKGFLSILKRYDGQILTNALAKKVARDLIKEGLYETMYLKRRADLADKIKNGVFLTDHEAKEVINNSPQNHKEAGFDKGWPSRFDTWFKLTKELGFVYYKQGKKIEFSKIGLMLVDNEHPEFEEQAFLNAFVKYQRNNPFKRVLNENVPLLLLLQVIKKINEDSEYNDAGITKKEIPIILCWKDNDVESLYQKIKEIRKKYGYTPSNEVILEICDELTNGRHASKKDKTIMQEYPDEFIRKMRLTGLITIRGGGRFIDINRNEEKKIDYIIKNYSSYKKFDSERKYFDYMASIDKKLVHIVIEYKIDARKEMQNLMKWVNNYKWDIIKSEMLKLAKNVSSKDDILKYISEPLRLEFLTALAIVSRHPNIRVKPNYISDDEGLPSGHAPGGKADIECDESNNWILVEVTILKGASQNVVEIPSISRHLRDAKEINKDSVSFFVAPIIHEYSREEADFQNHKYKIFIKPMSIDEFLKHLDTSAILYAAN